MERSPQPVREILSMLEEERAAYQALLEALEKEWECLKQNDTDTLISLLPFKKECLTKIHTLHPSIREALSRMKTPSNPPHRDPQGRRVVQQLREVDQVRGQVRRRNEQNRHFIEETLRYLKDLMGVWIGPPPEEPIYARIGKWASTPSFPCLSREV
jgi:hypothetical protein